MSNTQQYEQSIIALLFAWLSTTYRANGAYLAGELVTVANTIYRAAVATPTDAPSALSAQWTVAGTINPQRGRAYSLSESFPVIYSYSTMIRDAFGLGRGNSGVLEANLIIQPQTFQVDDTQQTTLLLLAELLNCALFRTDITEQLAALTSNMTIWNFTVDQSFQEDPRDGVFIWTFAASLRFSPTK